MNQFSCVRPRFFSISSFSLQRSHNGNVVHLVKINSQNLANCVCIYFDFISFLVKSLVLKPFPNLFCSNLSVKIVVKIKSHIHFCFKISVERKTVCFRNEGILTDGKSVLATVHIYITIHRSFFVWFCSKRRKFLWNNVISCV